MRHRKNNFLVLMMTLVLLVTGLTISAGQKASITPGSNQIAAQHMLVSLTGIRVEVRAAEAWVINGQEQPQIPFWYTLCEAVKAFMIGDKSPDSCGDSIS